MLELTFNVKPDEDGMINGLELASQLISMAGRLINPYVNKCPGCLDAVFSHLANHELETLHHLVRESKGNDNTSVLYCFAENNRAEVINKALSASRPMVEAMVQGQDEHHVNH